jgi:hypothetical protein
MLRFVTVPKYAYLAYYQQLPNYYHGIKLETYLVYSDQTVLLKIFIQQVAVIWVQALYCADKGDGTSKPHIFSSEFYL